MKNFKAEEARLRYLYRELLLKGKIKLPPEAARKIIGPDRGYHLYSLHPWDKGEKKIKRTTYHDLDHLSGAWTQEEADEFQEALQYQRTVPKAEK